VVWTWSGVRALQDDGGKRPSRVTRRSALATAVNGAGGFVTLYGGKLTTHRAFAEDVLDALKELGAKAGGPWTKDVPLHGGSLSRDALLVLAGQGPASIPHDVRRRWAFLYGDQIEALFDRLARDPKLAQEIAPGVTLAELAYAAEVEDAMTGEDFLLRRTKLHLTIDQRGRDAVAGWFRPGTQLHPRT
jgi:glycerol-3-phosphate dehydrogenase